MEAHWTYENRKDVVGDLVQGDILSALELRSSFGDNNLFFQNAEHIAFVVITQTCDLVRRSEEPCDADHINIAAIVELEAFLSKQLNRLCEKEGIPLGVCSDKYKTEVRLMLQRVLNQNEWKLGLFYFHPDYDNTSITEGAVALLRVNEAVPRREYENLIKARARGGRLKQEFCNKLGWMVGNLFSRIGTKDWCDIEGGKECLDELIDDVVNSESYTWIDDSALIAAREAGEDLKGISRAELLNIIKKHEPRPIEQLAVEVKQEADRVISRLEASVIDKLRSRPDLQAKLIDKIEKALREVLTDQFAQIHETIGNRFFNNKNVRRIWSRGH